MSSWDMSLWWMVGKISSKATAVVLTTRWCYHSCPYGLYQQKSNRAILRPSRGNSSTEWLDELSCSDLQHGQERNAAWSSSSKRCCPKKVRYRVSGKKEQITVLGCVNAIGQSIPPMVIFEGKYLNYQWTIGEVPGTYYGMSSKGWTCLGTG